MLQAFEIRFVCSKQFANRIIVISMNSCAVFAAWFKDESLEHTIYILPPKKNYIIILYQYSGCCATVLKQHTKYINISVRSFFLISCIYLDRFSFYTTEHTTFVCLCCMMCVLCVFEVFYYEFSFADTVARQTLYWTDVFIREFCLISERQIIEIVLFCYYLFKTVNHFAQTIIIQPKIILI